MLSVALHSIMNTVAYAECHNKFHYAESRFSESHCAECHYVGCLDKFHYAECLYAKSHSIPMNTYCEINSINRQ
jgi:hypothetical protein